MKRKYLNQSIRKLGEKNLHIVSFDVPYPADYGGVIDVYYRIKALNELGVKVVLHCFEYGRGQHESITQLVEKVYYYPRKKRFSDWLSKLPFIVKTRSSEALINNLLRDEHPILFEGLHTTCFLTDKRIQHRTKIVRTHNIEHEYYNKLANYSSGLKKLYYVSESKKLRRYESVLINADHILAIKDSDKKHFEQYGNAYVLPASTPHSGTKPKRATKSYALFHGNLSVQENYNGALWLIEKVFNVAGLNNSLIVAGKNPNRELEHICAQKNIRLITNPNMAQLEELINNARVHVFYSEQNTGIKLKLLQVLTSSGHIVVNREMISGSNLGETCTIVEGPDAYIRKIKKFLQEELSEDEFNSRTDFIKTHYNTLNNCRDIILPLI